MRLLAAVFIIITSHALGQVNDAKLANEYYQQGETEKAVTLFEELSGNQQAIPLIYSNYLDLLLKSQDFKQAENFLGNALKYFPNNTQYQVSLLKVYEVAGKTDAREKYLKKLRKYCADNNYALSDLAKHMANQRLDDDAMEFYKLARSIVGSDYAYALELAAIYRSKDMRDEMMEEYLNYASINAHGLSYVKNLFQTILEDEDDQDFLEQTLIKRMQQNPSDMMYPDLLIWLELQRKNFHSGFIQARAMDKRMNKPGDESIHIARIAMENEDWDAAIEIFTYIIKTYPEGRNYPSARTLCIQAKENKVKNLYPVDTSVIRSLSQEYQQLYNELGPNPYTLEALRSKALLHAFYLDEKDSAINTLNFIILNRRTPKHLVSLSKLDMGDIYLLKDEPWESTLLYSQVEKSDKSSPIGYEAKLRNAKLNYYTGNFALAKDHLDILKMATTREISNDAIALSLLINNNTVFDSTDHIMQEYANNELLVFQNKENEAIAGLNTMLEKYPRHSLVDEIHWELSKLNLKIGDYEKSVSHLDFIIENYSYDVLADDAFFTKAKIEEQYLNENDEESEKIIEILLNFLKTYPGSPHAAEARKIIRELRGDHIK